MPLRVKGLIAQLGTLLSRDMATKDICKHAPCGLCGLGTADGSAGTRRSNSSVMSGEPSMSGSIAVDRAEAEIGFASA